MSQIEEKELDTKKAFQELKIEINESNKVNLSGRLTGQLWFCLVIAVFGSGFQVGWNAGIYNIPAKFLKDFYNQTYQQRFNEPIPSSTLNLYWSITNGLLPLGAGFGALCSSFFADFFGRRKAMLLTNILVVISSILNIISKFIPAYETLIVSRFISGVFIGLFTVILPLYLNELPPQNYRGLIGTLNQLTIVLGIMVTNIIGLDKVLGTEKLWPVLVGLLLVPALVHLGLIFAVESPKHLFNKNQEEQAKQVLLKLRGPDDTELVENELELLRAEKLNQSQEKQVSYLDLFTKRHLLHPMLLAIGMQICQQFCGIEAVTFYSTTIFENVGLESDIATYATIGLGFVQLVMTIVCLFIVEKAGRRLLLIIGFTGMFISSFLLGIFSLVADAKGIKALNYLTIVAAVTYMIFFSIGPGPIPWLFTSEIFASDARAKANSIGVFINWFLAFVITSSFEFVNDAIGNYTFILFGCFTVLISLFVFLFVPETKNKTIEEISSILREKVIMVDLKTIFSRKSRVFVEPL